jgi:circadian clock protein KaiC
MAIERVKTGIEGLDKALNGGIPKKNIVLVSGGAGTGKSTLCMQYLINGCKMGDKGLYVSTEQNEEELKKAASNFGWDLDGLIKSGKLKIVYYDVLLTDNFLEKVHNIYTQFQPKRIVVDSLTTLTDSLLIHKNSLKDSSFTLVTLEEDMLPVPTTERIVSKQMLYRLIGKFKLYDATILMSSELLEESKGLSADEISEFICDGVIILNYVEIGVVDDRTMLIRKMRYTSHQKKPLLYDFMGSGIEIKSEQDALRL